MKRILLLLAAQILLLVGCSHNFEYSKEVFGEHLKFGKQIYIYDSPRAFNGDGYTIEIYELDDKFLGNIRSKENELMSKYPINYRDTTWRAERWKITPIKNNEDDVIRLATGGYMFTEKNAVNPSEIELEKKMVEIKEWCKEKGNYYGYLVKIYDEVIAFNVDFFIISPRCKQIMLINCNT